MRGQRMRRWRKSDDRVLFLDFDGVLHPAAVFQSRDELYLARNDIALFAWAPLLVRALTPYPDVRLVLSTSWVYALGFAEAKSWLPEELQRRTVGSTLDARNGRNWNLLSRYAQIQRYVQRNDCRYWVAVDDDVWDWSEAHRDNLVATSGERGLAEEGKLDELIRKLAGIVRA